MKIKETTIIYKCPHCKENLIIESDNLAIAFFALLILPIYIIYLIIKRINTTKNKYGDTAVVCKHCGKLVGVSKGPLGCSYKILSKDELLDILKPAIAIIQKNNITIGTYNEKKYSASIRFQFTHNITLKSFDGQIDYHRGKIFMDIGEFVGEFNLVKFADAVISTMEKDN